MEFVNEALGQSSGTVLIIAILCGIGILVGMDFFSNQTMGFLLFPVAVFASLCVSQLFRSLHLYSHKAFDQWVIFTVFAAAIGLGGSLVAYIVFSRIFGYAAADQSRGNRKELHVRHVRLDPPGHG